VERFNGKTRQGEGVKERREKRKERRGEEGRRLSEKECGSPVASVLGTSEMVCEYL